MKFTYKTILSPLVAHPRRIFLIDGIGACLSAVFLVALLIPFETYFGMPKPVSHGLALVAGSYALYSLCCYGLNIGHWRFFLSIIIIANIAYAGLTIGAIFYHYQHLTRLGVLYFLLELVVLLGVILLETRLISIKSTPKPFNNF